jgi:hypothetical protein
MKRRSTLIMEKGRNSGQELELNRARRLRLKRSKKNAKKFL